MKYPLRKLQCFYLDPTKTDHQKTPNF